MNRHLPCLIVATLLISCSDGGGDKNDGKKTISVTSAAFKEGERIPVNHTGEGKDLSPALSWTGVPKETKSLALICDDPDAPGKEPWTHWVIYNIPAGTTGLPEGVEKLEKPSNVSGAIQGNNDFKKTGYNGPMPPKGHGVHHYRFTLYALDAMLDPSKECDRKRLLKAMEGHILANGAMTGTYERKG